MDLLGQIQHIASSPIGFYSTSWATRPPEAAACHEAIVDASALALENVALEEFVLALCVSSPDRRRPRPRHDTPSTSDSESIRDSRSPERRRSRGTVLRESSAHPAMYSCPAPWARLSRMRSPQVPQAQADMTHLEPGKLPAKSRASAGPADRLQVRFAAGFAAGFALALADAVDPAAAGFLPASVAIRSARPWTSSIVSRVPHGAALRGSTSQNPAGRPSIRIERDSMCSGLPIGQACRRPTGPLMEAPDATRPAPLSNRDYHTQT